MAQWEATIELFMEWPKQDGKVGWMFSDRTLHAIGSTRKEALAYLGDRLTRAVQGDRFTLANFVTPKSDEKDIHVASVDLTSIKATRTQ